MRVVRLGVNRAVLGTEGAPAALGLHPAVIGLKARLLRAGADAVGHLVEAILQRLGPELDRLEEDVVLRVARHTVLLPRRRLRTNMYNRAVSIAFRAACPRYPSGAIQTRQSAARRTRIAATRKRKRPVKRRSGPNTSSPASRSRTTSHQRGHRAAARHPEQLGLDAKRRRPLGGCPYRLEVLLVGQRQPLVTEQHRRSSDTGQRQQVDDHERHPRLECAVECHPLRAWIDAHGHRREHHRASARGLGRDAGHVLSTIPQLGHLDREQLYARLIDAVRAGVVE